MLILLENLKAKIMGQECFLLWKNEKKLLLNFYKILSISYKNENAKDCKFVKQFWKRIFKTCNKKLYLIDSEPKGNYLHENPIKFLTSSLESSLCDYYDGYVLVTGNIVVAVANNNTKVAFKNCAPLRKCRTEINDTLTDEAELNCNACVQFD